MHRFQTKLVGGRKAPYTSWTFLVIPTGIARAWGPGRKGVRGTIAGHAFRGAASRGEGVLRMPIPRALREKAGIRTGKTVDVTLELDSSARPVRVPDELREAFNRDPDVAALYTKLPPSLRRAWASYVGDAKQKATRIRRASKAPSGIRARAFPT